jgi:hypothetical protein
VGVDGLDDAIAELRGIVARASDLGPVMLEIGAGAASEMKGNLVAQRSQGGAMVPLSPVYAARKAKRYPGKTILRATDAMLGSIVSNSGADFAEAGPTDEKARFHASPEPRRKIPLRDPFTVSQESVDAAEEALADYVGPKP